MPRAQGCARAAKHVLCRSCLGFLPRTVPVNTTHPSSGYVVQICQKPMYFDLAQRRVYAVL